MEKKAEKGLIRTFLLKTLNKKRFQQTLRRRQYGEKGYTLIEMLVVVALIGLISAFALPSVNNYFKLSLNSATREMASVVKETYNSAAMTGKVYRIVYDFKAGSFWVESGPSTVLLDTTETREREQRRKRFAKDSDKPPASEFTMDKSVTRKKISLPRGVDFEDLITEQSSEPITEGTAYTHFFPNGMTEQTVIHLKDNSNHHVTLIITPLIGRTRLVERYLSKNEIYGE